MRKLYSVYQFIDFFNFSNLVASNVKDNKFSTWLKTIELFNKVVRKPKFFQGGTNFFKSTDLFDKISAQWQNFKISWRLYQNFVLTQAWKRKHSINSVTRQWQLDNICQCIQSLGIHSVNWGVFIHKLYFSGFQRRFSVGFFL